VGLALSTQPIEKRQFRNLTDAAYSADRLSFLSRVHPQQPILSRGWSSANAHRLATPTHPAGSKQGSGGGSKWIEMRRLFFLFLFPLSNSNVTTLIHPAAILPLCFPPPSALSPCFRVVSVIDFAFTDHFRSGAATRRRERDGDEAELSRAELNGSGSGSQSAHSLNSIAHREIKHNLNTNNEATARTPAQHHCSNNRPQTAAAADTVRSAPLLLSPFAPPELG